MKMKKAQTVIKIFRQNVRAENKTKQISSNQKVKNWVFSDSHYQKQPLSFIQCLEYCLE